MLNLLFVYGSLRSGFDNRWAQELRSQSDFLGQATVQGSLHQHGDYPAFRSGSEAEVLGELYRLNQPEIILASLDEYEGDEYQRVVIKTSGGEAWIYQAKTA